MTDLLDRVNSALASHYAIERELGAGGMATVYLAEDLKHKRSVAIKVLRPELAATLAADRFQREIEVAAKLVHPHILPVLDSGTIEEQPSARPPDARPGHGPGLGPSALLYYVMPYVNGESLRDRLNREGQLPIDDAVSIAIEVVDALASAHRLGVVHRDIKPENILLQEGHAVVADFGIAKAVLEAADERLTETGIAVGTPYYMSPEQATAEDVDGRSDIYSLGCVLYEMLTGEPPFDGSTAAHIIRKHVSAEVVPITVVRPTVSESLSNTITKALAKEPADRFQTADQFAEGLRSRAVAAPYRVRPAQRFHSLVAGTLAFAAIVLLSWWLFNTFIRDTDPFDSIAVLPLENLTGDSTNDHIVHGIHSALISNLGELSAFDRVIARQSMLQFAATTLSVSEIASFLDVRAILGGSVLSQGDSVQITLQLSDGRTDRQIWSNQYSGNFRDVLALQNEVTRAIVDEIRLTLTPSEENRLAESVRTVDPEAYELVMRGRQLLDLRWTADAEVSFQEAIARDSTYAAAHLGLANTYNVLGFYVTSTPSADAFPRARDAALLALHLDSTLADAHVQLSWTSAVYDWDWSDAERGFRLALSLNPGNRQAHFWYAFLLHWLGRYSEAVSELERALELDPIGLGTRPSAANTFRRMRMCDRAIQESRRAEELAAVLHLGIPRDPSFVIGTCHLQEGRFEDAIPLMERGVETADSGLVAQYTAELAHAYAVAGNRATALELLQDVLQIERTQYFPPYLVALVYAGLGENDQAFSWLERAIEVRDIWLVFLNVEPRWDSIREDPRFIELLRTMNFVE